jgi:divalent metal cation (Fe/Co/Zn/Cd) transporter
MERHAADLFSLLAGLLTLGLGLLLLSGGVSEVPMEWVGPAAAIGIGLLILVAARPNRGSDAEAPATTDEA